MSELRWNPILQEWVITATQRQDRTFLPPKDYCPLCPTKLGSAFPTEVPAPTYEIVSFDNKFPALRREPPQPAIEPEWLYRVAPSQGVCEVILYTPQHDSTLTERSIEEIDQLIQVWTDRTVELSALPYVKYVLIFENKGQVIGVTIAHPHGQLYAFPFIPPKLQQEINSAIQYHREHGACLFCDVVRQELAGGRRIVWENEHWLAVVPFYARWPYEVHLLARRHRRTLAELEPIERRSLAETLKAVLLKYDGLWDMSMPYMMAIHQAPADNSDEGTFHLHIEFYPPHRTKEKLKYLASVESSAGTFINDTLPEEKAAELRAVAPQSPADLQR